MISNTTSDNSYGFRYESLLFVPVLLGTIVGIPGTLLTMRFYSKRIKKSSTSTSLFLTSLAVFDSLSLLTNIPGSVIALYTSYVDGWRTNHVNTIEVYVTRIPKYWSNMTLLLIGIERVVSVVLPHRMNAIFTKRVGIVGVSVVIVLGPLVLFPLSIQPLQVALPSNGTITHVQRLPQTLIDPKVFARLASFPFLFYFGIPMGGVLCSNLCLVVVLLHRYRSKHAVNIRAELTPSQMKELRTTKLVMIVTAIFILSAFPLVIAYPLILNSTEPALIQHLLIIGPVSDFLETINYSMNFFVYYNGSDKFRLETREFISRSCCCCKPGTITPGEESEST